MPINSILERCRKVYEDLPINQDFVLNSALELCRKVYEDPLFEENFHRAAKAVERLLMKAPEIIISSEVSWVNYNEETGKLVINIQGTQKLEEAKKDVYHETSHVLFAKYRSITGDKFLKKTNHSVIKNAHQFIREYSEKAKNKFTWKYFLIPFLKFGDFISREKGIYSVDIDKIEMYDEETQQKALKWLDEVAIESLSTYYMEKI